MMEFVDSHCHLNFPELAQRLPDILNKMVENRVSHALCIAVNLADFPQVRALAEQYPHLYASVGIHPDVEDSSEPDVNQLLGQLLILADHPRVVAIGETGLDYYRLSGDRQRQRQQQRFRAHIQASRASGKPLVVHTRQAAEDTLRILNEEGASPQAGGAAGVIHCFTETQEFAEQAIALGFYISFSGIVTFKNAQALQEIARHIPLERMLIETDAPYLAPVPYRGKQNEPGLVRHVAEFIANLRGIPIEEVARHTTDNFFRLFHAP